MKCIIFIAISNLQHHYEDHGDDWSSNWKRESAPQDRDFAQRLAYNNAYPQQH